MMSGERDEGARLEQLWGGEFGDAYVERNLRAGEGRDVFWRKVLGRYECGTILEVGCNVGANVRWLAELIEPHNVYGVDVNVRALRQLRAAQPDVNALWGVARGLPFRDEWFDMVFTTGVLIHQPEETLGEVMAEVVRCARRYVLCGEYFAAENVQVPYRDQTDALFKRDYGRLYQEMFPNLKLLETGFLSRAEGWDDVTYWIFEK